MDTGEAHVPGPAAVSKLQIRLEDQQFRVLRLLGGAFESPLSCELDVVSLTDRPKYEALSYAWGDQSIRTFIQLDGVPFHITRNLRAALRHLRHPTEERLLWVDALCINQDDNVDKSHQVNLMGKIYSNACLCLLWLGHEDEATTTIDDTSIGFSQKSAATAFEAIRTLATSDRATCDGSIPSILSDEVIQDLQVLVTLPWWNRVWTVQEAVLPKEALIIYGHLELAWATFKTASDNFRAHSTQCCSFSYQQGEVLAIFYDRVKEIDWFRADAKERMHISEALLLFRRRHAMDSRDNIFGLLGLSRSAKSALIADYTRLKMPVYRDTTVHLMKETKSLFPLIRGTEIDRDLGLPSWVPDWEARVGEGLSDLEARWIFRYPLFDAAGGRQLIMETDWESELKLQGVVVDQIAEIFLPAPYDGSMERNFKSVSSWKKALSSRYSPDTDYPTEETYREAFWRLIICDSNMEERADLGIRGYRRTHKHEHQDGLEQIIESGNFIELYNFGLGDRVFYITKSGLIGLGPVEMMVGDHLFALCGGNCPFVLRPSVKSNDTQKWKYIGHTYAQGMMDGEAFRGIEKLESIILV